MATTKLPKPHKPQPVNPNQVRQFLADARKKAAAARKHLDPAQAPAFDLFDRMRRKRNIAFYDISFISDVEAEDAVRAAEDYLKVVAADIQTRIP